MIPTFVIFLREGIEASMIVAILLAYLDSTGQRRHFRDIFAGVAAAMVLVIAGGVAAYVLIHRYDGSRIQTIFEGATYVVAAVALTYMTLWMGRHARTMGRELRERSEAALSGGSRLGLATLAFTAVGREGLETMVFTLAIVFASQSQSATGVVHSQYLIVGALGGLAVALGVAVAIYRVGRQLNLRVFFRVLGIVLMFFAAGLVADAIENLQQLGWLNVGTHVLWNSSTVISESSSTGDLFHSLLGYADHPTVAQVVAYVVYIVAALWAVRRVTHHPRTSQPTRTTPVARHHGATEAP